MKRVVLGFLGPTLDGGLGLRRLKKWRPTVASVMHDDLPVDEIIIFYQREFRNLLRVIVKDIKVESPRTKITPRQVTINDPWDFEEVYALLYDFSRSYRFKEDVEYLVNITTGTHVIQICLFLLTESNFLPGKLLQMGRVPDTGVAGEYQIIDLNLGRYDKIASRFAEEARTDTVFLKSGIETKNVEFNELIEKIEQIAQLTVEPMLLTGPTGAGKSHLARKIYELKVQKGVLSGDFIELNCATLRADAAMSALFGHKRGAFTGAISERKGSLLAAHGGIVFLDEIGELGLDEQAMLLRAIEDKRFTPVGSDVEVCSDFQLICGTNKDLLCEAREGRFRSDLLARINLWTFRLPSLAERREDIEPNISYELEKFARKYNRRCTFNKEAEERFLSFAHSPKALWSANFRDLNGAITRMATLAPSGRINRETVDEELRNLSRQWECGDAEFPQLKRVLPLSQIDEIDLFDRMQLEATLEIAQRCDNMSHLGRELFAESRKKKGTTNDSDRIRKYLGKFGITWEMIKG